MTASAPHPRPQSRAPGGTFYRALWRWHFYAGLFVAPVLFVVSVTGGMYVFKDELEGLLYTSALYTEPGPARVPLEAQIAAAKAGLPEGYRAGSVSMWADATRTTEVFCQAKGKPFRQVYVDPYTGAVRGELSGDGLFRTVLKVHRTLFLGPAGRAVVELATGWTVILLVTGLGLWWPRTRSAAGVLYPRLRAKPYAVLRDLHAVAGFYFLPVALVIALTGLMYTQVWGSGYRLAAAVAGGADEPDEPASVSPPTAAGLPFDAGFAVARARYPDAAVLTLSLPAKPDDPLAFFAAGTAGPLLQGTLALDRATGEVLKDRPSDETPALRRWPNWNYTLHVGSVLGTPSKIIWLLACSVLSALPVTGLWMWWKRRPTGRTGFPRRPDVRIPRPALAAAGVLCAFLPLVGESAAFILLAEWAAGRVAARRGRPAANTVAPVTLP